MHSVLNGGLGLYRGPGLKLQVQPARGNPSCLEKAFGDVEFEGCQLPGFLCSPYFCYSFMLA